MTKRTIVDDNVTTRGVSFEGHAPHLALHKGAKRFACGGRQARKEECVPHSAAERILNGQSQAVECISATAT